MEWVVPNPAPILTNVARACKALKADQVFGFVAPSQGGGMRVGTLARIRSSRFTDDDAKDGSCHMTVPSPEGQPTPTPSPASPAEPGFTGLTVPDLALLLSLRQVVGTRRFTLGRQWEEKCAGCNEITDAGVSAVRRARPNIIMHDTRKERR